jgi:hypothetical protein
MLTVVKKMLSDSEIGCPDDRDSFGNVLGNRIATIVSGQVCFCTRKDHIINDMNEISSYNHRKI